jgi:transposase
MKFVATKTADQLDLQALHRVRERLVRQRTGTINQIRAFLLERGVAVRQGLGSTTGSKSWQSRSRRSRARTPAASG